jgi:hypothetical protein
MSKIEIIVEAETKKAQRELENLNDEISRTENEAEKQNDAFGGTAVSLNAMIEIAQQAVEALKAIYATAREGAELNFLQGKFENLAESINTTADALLEEMHIATKNTMSDMEAMATVTELVGLGLAGDAEEAVRLARVMSGLNMNSNQLTLTLTNMTTMRFDALGVRVDGFKERLQDLKDQGLDTDSAFKEAFLQQAERQLDLVGDAADSQLGTFKKLEARFKNLGDENKTFISDALEPSIALWLDQAEAIDEAVEAYDELFGEALAPDLYLRNRDEIDETIKKQREWNDFTDKMPQSFNRMEAAIKESTEPMKSLSFAFGGLLDATKQSGAELDKFHAEQEKLNTSLDEGKITLDEYNQAIDANTEKFEENTNKRILKRVEERLAADGLTVAEEEFLLRQGLAMGLYTEEYILEAGRVIQETEKMVADFNALDGKRVSVFVTTFLNSIGVSEGGLSKMPGFARGGIVNAPASGAPAMLHGHEAVIPLQNGAVPVDLGRGGGAGVTLVYSPAISLGTEQEAQDVLLPFIQRGIREAQAV